MPAVGVEVDARERARAERQLAGRGLDGGEALAVAREHPEVREQVMAEVDRLGALQVRVAGHRQSRWRSAAPSSARISAAIPSPAACACARVNSAMSVATWSLRERAVCSLPPTGPASSVTRRSIAMWMSSSSGRNGNVPSLQLVLDRVERREQLVAVLGGDDRLRREHARVGARQVDVVGAEPPVEADRGVELPEDRVLRLAEAGHRRRSLRDAARRPSDRRAAASATRATWPSVIAGKNGSAIERAATSSHTGNSPSRWPKRSR